MKNKYIRVAALLHVAMGTEMVKVIFRMSGRSRERAGNEVAYWVKPRVYGAIPLGTIATIEDYKKHGEIVEANNTDIYDIEVQ